MPDERYLTAGEACAVLGVDRSTLIRWVDAHRATPAQKLPGKTGAYLFEAGEIARLLVERGLEKAPRAAWSKIPCSPNR